MATASSSSEPVIGILSIGDMGSGIATLLLAHKYLVTTCTAGRSKTTLDRIKATGIKAYETDVEWLANTDVVLSIVPPRDAVGTAKRVLEASREGKALEGRRERLGLMEENETVVDVPMDQGIIYIDLNAISPMTSRGIASLFASSATEDRQDSKTPVSKSPPASPRAALASPASTQTQAQSPPSPPTQAQSPPQPRRLSLRQRLSNFTTGTSLPHPPSIASLISPSEPPPAIPILYLDGGIIGGPPKPSSALGTTTVTPSSSSNNAQQEWSKPSLPISGPTSVTSLLSSELQQVLNMQILSPTIGAASVLKSSFASLTKGLTALAVLSFTTAHTHNLLPHLISHLENYSPGHLRIIQGSLPNMPGKAYRWVDEMREIGESFSGNIEEEWGAGMAFGQDVFNGIAELYRFVADETDLAKQGANSGGGSGGGGSGAGKRKASTMTVEDVAEGIRVGLERKRRKRDGVKEVGGDIGDISGRKGSGKGRRELEIAWRGSWS